MASLLRNGNHTILRRCFINNNTRTINVTQRRSYHLTLRKSNAAAAGHHHYPPPMPPHARSPAAFEKIVENKDCLWDDGVAPELALDFDAPNVSSREALLTTICGLSMFAVLWYVLEWTGVPENPALGHETDVVYPDYSQPDVIPPPKK